MTRIDLVAAIIAKDLRLFSRDRFYVFISVLTLVMFGGLFWALPATVSTQVSVGVHLPGAEGLLDDALADDVDRTGDKGLAVSSYATANSLEAAVADGDDIVAGLSFPEGFVHSVATGQATTVRVLLAADAPESLRPALTGAVRELAFAVAGRGPPVTLPDLDEVVVGTDRSTAPLPLRDALRPMIVFVVLAMEMFALAALVATEISGRTATAVLVTTARLADLLTAKAALGTLLAFGQALVIAAVTGTLASAPTVVVVALLLGALLVTGLGLLAGATGGDFITIVFWSVLLFVPLAIPAFAVLFPGTPAAWVQALPSYGLVETLVRTGGHDESWSDVWPYLTILAGWCVAVFAAGLGVLARRVARM